MAASDVQNKVVVLGFFCLFVFLLVFWGRGSLFFFFLLLLLLMLTFQVDLFFPTVYQLFIE